MLIFVMSIAILGKMCYPIYKKNKRAGKRAVDEASVFRAIKKIAVREVLEGSAVPCRDFLMGERRPL